MCVHDKWWLFLSFKIFCSHRVQQLISQQRKCCPDFILYDSLSTHTLSLINHLATLKGPTWWIIHFTNVHLEPVNVFPRNRKSSSAASFACSAEKQHTGNLSLVTPQWAQTFPPGHWVQLCSSNDQDLYMCICILCVFQTPYKAEVMAFMMTRWWAR